MYARLRSILQKPDAARKEKMTKRANKTASEAVKRRNRLMPESRGDSKLRKNRAWSQRDTARRNVVTLLIRSETVATT
jgi:hypothetical protein